MHDGFSMGRSERWSRGCSCVKTSGYITTMLDSMHYALALALIHAELSCGVFFVCGPAACISAVISTFLF